jgi:tryptophan synthase alpha subunit
MIWREVRHIECVAHEVLGLWNVDDVCVVVDALKNLERAISSWLELGVPFLREPVLAEV